jgi:hypothetical protein
MRPWTPHIWQSFIRQGGQRLSRWCELVFWIRKMFRRVRIHKKKN